MHIALGVLLIIVGIAALWAQMFTTLASIYFLGWVLIVAGVAQFFYGITSGSAGKTLFSILLGLASTLIGLVAVFNPALSAITFTLFIAMLLIFSGLYRSIATVVERGTNWGLSLTGGILSLVLGLVVLLNWPVSGFFFIGLFIAFELIMSGILLITQPALYIEKNREMGYPTSPYFTGAKGGKAKKKDEKKKDNR